MGGEGTTALKWTVFPRQLEFIARSRKGFNLASGAIRSGKTIASIIRFIYFLIEEAQDGVDCLITSRHLNLIEKNVFGPMRQIINSEGLTSVFDFRENPKKVVFRVPSSEGVKGKEITCYCAGAKDQKSMEYIQGMTIQAAFMDEVALYPKNFFDMVIDRLSAPPRFLIMTCNPASKSHYLYQRWILPGKVNFFPFKLSDNPSLSPEYVDTIRGNHTGTMYERLIDGEWGGSDDSLVVPEYEENREEIFKELPLPSSFIPMMACDVGGVIRDFMFCVFGYYDFANDRIVIEDEVVFKKSMNTDMLAKAVMLKEQELWGRPAEARYTDVDWRLVQDMLDLHGLLFLVTPKDDKMAALNNLRVLLKRKKFFVSPKCVELDKHLSGAIWNSRHTDYERTEECGHFDGVDAAIYFVRNLLKSNPFPAEQSSQTRFYAQQRIPRKESLLQVGGGDYYVD